MSAHGKIIKPVEEELSIIVMVGLIKETLLMDKHMDMENIYTQKVTFMKENGQTMSQMEKVKKYGLTDQSLMETLRMV